MPRVNPTVVELPASIPFVAPEESERELGQLFKARLGANEGNFGPSPLAVEAMVTAASAHAWKYGDPTGFDLRLALSERLAVAPETIVLGAGIDNLLGLIVRIFSDAGDPIVSSLGAYPTFNYHVTGFGRRLVTVPYASFHEDLDGLSEAVHETSAPIVYLSNPDNPMGTWWSAAAMVGFAQSLPETTLLVLDEAYAETAPDDAIAAIGALPDNVIRMRTFSKAYGLAGLRCGYAIGSADVIGQFNKVRDHFGINVMAQKAALAALQDDDYLAATLDNIADARERIAAIGQANGLSPVESATNFVTLETDRDGAFAMALTKALMTSQVFVRKPMAPGLDHCIRVSAGRPDELDWFEEVLPTAIGQCY